MNPAKTELNTDFQWIQARMLNEFVYCPRLFYFEFVEGIFVHNADTLKGSAQHKRVDKGKGALPSAKKTGKSEKKEVVSEESEIIHSSSVNLGSERLGVSAKLDLVEVKFDADKSDSSFTVQPVEYKKGAPKEEDDGKTLWDTDRMQLGLQILLLRDNGYNCDEGIIYYRETRQRVCFKLDNDTENWILNQIVLARKCAKGQLPAPLENSPKCARCSLAPVCLPDETTWLRQELKGNTDEEVSDQMQLALENTPAEPQQLTTDVIINFPVKNYPDLMPVNPVRRSLAQDIETRTFYLNTPGIYLSKKSGCLVAKEKGKVIQEILIKDVHHLALFGPIQISTAVIQTLCEREVPITYFSMGGWFYGMTHGHGLKNIFTRIEQFRFAGDSETCLNLSRYFVHGKIRNQRTLLMRNHIEPPRGILKQLKYAANSALAANSMASLLGIEGAAAHVYFQNFSGLIKTGKIQEESGDDSQLEFGFQFEKRNRRPPRDAVNAMLSLAYSLLVRDCTLAALAVGFDPYLGFYHQPRFGRPALALDIIEEFRPIIADSVVITLINNRMLKPENFVMAGQSVNLAAVGRKTFFQAYEKRLATVVTHPVFDYKVSYRRAIELQFRILAKTLTGEIPNYIPFITR